jgi:hypothetical protein
VAFLEVLRFPLPVLIPPNAPQLLIIPSLILYSLDSDGVATKQRNDILKPETDRSLVTWYIDYVHAAC